MRRWLAICAVVLALPAQADVVEECSQDRDWWLRLQACTQAIESRRWPSSRNSWAYSNRAVAHAALGNYIEAFDDHRIAVRLNPRDARARNNKANSHADFREYDRALAEYGAALDIDPGYVAARFNRAVVLVTVGRHADARDDYARVIAERPGLGAAWLGRAEAACKLGEAEGSVADRLKAIELGALVPTRVRSYLAEKGYALADDGPGGLEDALRTWTEAGCP